ncbi:MAG TPA: hypothetical protein VLL08_15470 [Kineosporiaceae bacterium]|nr:hypothetical protein [Kineosporiaceae bacterium]
MNQLLRPVAIVAGLAGTSLAIWALVSGTLLTPAILLILFAGGLGAMARGK